MDLSTIIGSKVGTSVEVNSLVLPANSLPSHLQRFSEPALFNSDGFGVYGLSKSGSLTKVKLHGKYFALLSYHQLTANQYDFDELSLFNPDRKSMFTSHSAVFPNGNAHNNEDFDCVLFEFTDVVKAGKLSHSGWYDLGRDIFRQELPRPSAIICIGYPGYRNNIDFEKLEYPVSPNLVFGHEFDGKISGRLSFKPEPKLSFDPAGMSGSPVFGLDLDSGALTIFFAGVLTNASSQMFNFISVTRLKSLFEQQT